MFPIFFPIKHVQLQGALLSSFPPGPWTASGHSPCKPRGVLLISTEGGRVCPAFPLNMGAFPTEMLDFTMIFTTMLPMKWIQMVDFTIKEIGTWTPKNRNSPSKNDDLPKEMLVLPWMWGWTIKHWGATNGDNIYIHICIFGTWWDTKNELMHCACSVSTHWTWCWSKHKLGFNQQQ